MSNVLGLRIAEARQKAGLSQAELGEKSGIAQTQISRYESGRAAPRRESIEKLAKALDVPLDWLLSAALEDGSGAEGGEFVFQPSPENLEKLKALSTLTGKTPDELVQQMFAEMEAHLLGDPKIASEFLSDLTRQSAAAAAQKVTILQAKGSHALEMGQPTIKQGPPPDPEAKD
ncbi:helix-turn-helix transcriptional regulator [Delftia acidovorans]|uniref:helix-turn-helix domain-containing protein n=1 Tax=Delftia acidovorans TaxID=80866 RepID=UPI0028E38C6E|nr:helix-turn-helix transcriptional regulator [Delftia acidovorans]